MNRILVHHIAALLLITLSIAANAQSLPERLENLLNMPLLRHSEAGISVYDLTDRKVIFTHNDKKACRPASTEKVITAVSALWKLGTDYQVSTQLLYDGNITDGTLHGNLYIKGGFDSEFTYEDMQQLAANAAQAGIRRIEGSIIGDVSMKDSLYYGEGWSWDDAPYYFQPYLSPLIFNKGCVEVTVSPTQKDSLAYVSISPRSSYYTLSNNARSYCPQAGKLKIGRNWMYQSNEIEVSGNCSGTTRRTVPVFDSASFFLYAFSECLQHNGIETGVYEFGQVPEHANRIGEIKRPITAIIKQAMKKSDNLSAEALFYNLARWKSPERPAHASDGTEAIEQCIEELGYITDHYQIADGSGVSLYNYISTDLLLGFLIHAYDNKAIFDILYEALPIAGVDGTLSNRMKKTKAFRRVRAKTGTVTGISSLAGYAKASNGHLLAFVIINQNVLKGSQARAFQDKVCSELCK